MEDGKFRAKGRKRRGKYKEKEQTIREKITNRREKQIVGRAKMEKNGEEERGKKNAHQRGRREKKKNKARNRETGGRNGGEGMSSRK